MDRFHFPAWVNKFIPILLGVVLLGGGYAAAMLVYVGNPYTLNTGYAPEQPVPFSHALHSGKLKMDCRYCHTHVEEAAHSNLPTTSVCYKCHSGKDKNGVTLYSAVHSESTKLAPVRESYETGKSIPWVRIHDLPDYAYFNHSAHVTRGVSCVSCHGRVDRMEVVQQVEPLSMGWCLECHRNPTPNLRPREFVTNLGWEPAPGTDREAMGEVLAAKYHVYDATKDENFFALNPLTQCTTCHR